MKALTNAILVAIVSLFLFGCGQGKDQVGEDLPLTVSAENAESLKDPGTVSVQVLNGCGVDGLAKQVADKIRELGYTSIKADNYRDENGLVDHRVNFTVVEYLNGFGENAGKLAELLGGSRLQEESVLSGDIVVILGKDLDQKTLLVDNSYGLPKTTVENETGVVPLEGTDPAINLSPPKDGIYIDKSENILRLYKDGNLVVEYPCCTGKDGDTPEGVYEINSKVVNPTWYWQGKAIPPGPDNGLGTRFLGINKPGYGIHGTNEPDSIGYSLSHGCVRLHNEDVEKLYDMVEIGTTVVIGP
jgi:hypothetical protein